MEGELQRTVGRNLRAIRESRGLSQEAFADILGVHRTYMGGIERGERNLTLRSLERMAKRAGLDPLALLQPPGHVSFRHELASLLAPHERRERQYAASGCELPHRQARTAQGRLEARLEHAR